MSKKFFNAPYGYMESVGLVSKKTQVENLLSDVKENYAENVELDAAQEEKISANTTAIENEVTRSTEQDTDFQEALDLEVSERKRMGSILNDKIAAVEALVNENSSSSSSLISDLQSKDSELESNIDVLNTKLENEISECEERYNEVSASVVELSNKVNVDLETLKTDLTNAFESADTQLQSNIDAANQAIENEKADRLQQDIVVMTNVANVRKNLEAADEKLVSDLTAIESSLRGSIDILSKQGNSLNNSITTLETDLSNLKTSGISLNKISTLEYDLLVNGVSKGKINIPEDNFLKSVRLVSDTILEFTFIANGTESIVNVDISNLVDVYTAGNGLTMSDNQFSVLVDEKRSEPYIVSTQYGLKIEGVDLAIETAVEAAVANEASLRDSADNLIKTEISTVNTNISTVKLSVTAEENRAKGIEQGLENRIIKLEDYTSTIKANEADIKVLKTNLSNEITRATNAETDLTDRLDKVEENKVDWTDLGNNRKAITLKNNDLLLGTATNGSTYNVAMLSKWDVVDLGTSSLPINLNTPKGVRPTVQEAGQSGEEANKIAYLSDVETVKESVPSLDGYATEEWVESKGYLSEHQDISNLATKEEIKDIVKYSEGVDKKVILLENGDLIMGKVNEESAIQPDPTASTLTLLQLNKWNIVDVGSPKTIVNLNVHEGYRPTVQESNQSGEEAHEIAYLEDIDALKELITDLQNRIKVLESKAYNGNQFIDMLSSLEEGKTSDIVLYNNITIDTMDKLVIPKNATLNLDLNGQTLNFNVNDILFRLQEGATLNIGGGTYVGKGYVASANAKATVNVTDGSYETQVTCFQANGGYINIYGGYFNTTSEKYGSKYTLNHIDKNKYVGKITVYGGTFVNYDPSNSPSENPAMNFVADGYGVVSELDENGKTLYTVVKTNEVSSSEDFKILLNSLGSDEDVHIKLLDSFEVDATSEPIVINGDVNIDLNGQTITYSPSTTNILFRVNGNLTIGNGIIDAKGYVASANQGSIVTVLNGTYNCDVTCFQSNGGVLNVNDGYFSACNDTYGCKYTLNFIDSMKEIGEINVTGGKFVGYDPSNSNSENPKENFVSEGYKVEEKVEDGLTIYEVVKE